MVDAPVKIRDMQALSTKKALDSKNCDVHLQMAVYFCRLAMRGL